MYSQMHILLYLSHRARLQQYRIPSATFPSVPHTTSDEKNTFWPQRKPKKGRPKLVTMQQNFNLEFKVPQSTSYLSVHARNTPRVFTRDSDSALQHQPFMCTVMPSLYSEPQCGKTVHWYHCYCWPWAIQQQRRQKSLVSSNTVMGKANQHTERQRGWRAWLLSGGWVPPLR